MAQTFGPLALGVLILAEVCHAYGEFSRPYQCHPPESRQRDCTIEEIENCTVNNWENQYY